MASNREARLRKRLRSSNISATVSISLVLLMLALLGLLLTSAQSISVYVKENMGFTIFFNDDAREVDIIQFQKFLDADNFAKSTQYKTKEEMAIELQENMGEDFVNFLGYNPLKSTIDVKLNASHAHPDTILSLASAIGQDPKVFEVHYVPSMVEAIHEKLQVAELFIIIFCILLSLIAIVLINNTIRLSIYSKRFLIKTMQLIGATQGFIRQPFIISGIFRGIIGALIANSLIAGIIYSLLDFVPELFFLLNTDLLIMLAVAVFLSGILISWFSTTFAVSKYLRLKADDLYY